MPSRSRPPAPRVVFLLLPLLLWLGCSTAFASPFTPLRDDEVVERLPPGDPALRQAQSLRRQLAAPGATTALRVETARRFFELALAQGDPRHVGLASGALAPLHAAPPADAGYWLVRGLIEQYQHAFEAALASLARATQLDPRDPEPPAWRAAVLMVQARYDEALVECDRLAPIAPALWTTGCRAYARAATGALQPAYSALLKALAEDPGAPAPLRLWVLTRLAEMAQRLQLAADAERHLEQAAALGLSDTFLLATHADLLLAQRRPQEVLRLLARWERADALLLRLAIAARDAGDPRAREWAGQLRDRFEAAERRGDRLHDYEAGRFALEVDNDPERALRLAAASYVTQREPRDAALLMRAAIAARQPAAAAPALAWLRASRHEDPALTALAVALEAMEARR